MTLKHKQARAKHLNAYRNSLTKSAILNEERYQADIRKSALYKKLGDAIIFIGILIILLTAYSLVEN